jgi:hypothetical protein
MARTKQSSGRTYNRRPSGRWPSLDQVQTSLLRAVAAARSRNGVSNWKPRGSSRATSSGVLSRSGGAPGTTRTAKKRKRMSGLRYRTSGYLNKPFRKPYKRGVSGYQKWGFVEHVEGGGVVTNDDVVYIGHSFAHDRVVLNVCQAISRKLAAMAGYNVTSMQELIQEAGGGSLVSPGNLVIVYTNGVIQHASFDSTAIPADYSWYQLAELLNSRVFAIAQACASNGMHLKSIALEPSETQFRVARVEGDGMLVDMYHTSNLALQNRTLALASGTGVDEGNRNDVANNPLGGRSYSGRGNGTDVRYVAQSAVTTTWLSGRVQDGMIIFDVNGAGIEPEMKAVLKRPASKSAFSTVNATGPAQLNPGAIRSSKIMYKKTMYLKTFVNMLALFLQSGNPATNLRHNLGYYRFYGFEKKCNTRTDEPSINVGYEINTVYRTKVRMVKKGCAVSQVVL